MGMNLECMLYLQNKGLLSPEKSKMLDIGPKMYISVLKNKYRALLRRKVVRQILLNLQVKLNA